MDFTSLAINGMLFISGFVFGSKMVAKEIFYKVNKMTCQKHKDPRGSSIKFNKISTYPIKPAHNCRYYDIQTRICSLDKEKCLY